MFSVAEIIQATEGKLIRGPGAGKVSGLGIDSRQVLKTQAFVAVKGDIFDGHDFLRDVVSKGVRTVVVHRPVQLNNDDINVILVEDTTRALGLLARFHRQRFKVPVIALTGSAGKTTTKEMIAAVLSSKYKVLKNEGTQNNHIGVPLTLLRLTRRHQIVVVECGSNQPGDIPWLADVVRPDAALFTNIGESHLERLRTLKGVLKEKWTLTRFLPPKGVILVNADDPLLTLEAKRQKRHRVLTWGIKKPALYNPKNVQFKGHRIEFTINGRTVQVNSCATISVYNALAAFACGVLFNVPVPKIIAALGRFQFPQGRGQIVRLGRGWLINDAYNANPVSMRGALQTLDALDVDGKKIFVAADMLELGSRAKSLHRAMGEATAVSSVNSLIAVGQLAKIMAAQARHRNRHLQVFACANAEAAQKRLLEIFQNGDAVLVKGSRRMRMEQVVDFLLASPQAG